MIVSYLCHCDIFHIFVCYLCHRMSLYITGHYCTICITSAYPLLGHNGTQTLSDSILFVRNSYFLTQKIEAVSLEILSSDRFQPFILYNLFSSLLPLLILLLLLLLLLLIIGVIGVVSFLHMLCLFDFS